MSAPHSALPGLTEAEVSGIIAMAWQDDTPFEAIALQFGLREAEVVALMRQALKARSFKVWRMRVRGRAAKHAARQAQVDPNTRPQTRPQARAEAEALAQAEAEPALRPDPAGPLTLASLR